jgi:hypothetical protein
MDKDWHVHNPYLGEENPSSEDLLAYALDGFPIYGPLVDASVLDACNGRTVNGKYQYHVKVSIVLDHSYLLSSPSCARYDIPHLSICVDRK